MFDRRILSVVVALLIGCGGGATGETTTPEGAAAAPADETPALGSPASVRLVEAGNAPFEPIRYRIAAGTTWAAKLELHMNMGMRLGDQEVPMPNLPPSRTSLQITATEVSPTGDAHLTFTIESVEILDADQYDAQVVASMSEGYEAIRNFSGSMDMSPLGVATNAVINIPESVDEITRSVPEDMRKSLTQLSTLLPSEPVGVGARWIARQRLLVRGIEVQQAINYQLDRREGDVLTITANVAQTAHDAAMQLPGLPEGARVVVDSLESSGSGQSELNLTSVVPSADATVHTNVSARIIAEGQEQALNMRMEVSVHHVPGSI